MDRLDWKGVLTGAILAAAIDLAAGFVLPTGSGGAADPATVVSVAVSFLAYGLGGYIAGRVAGRAGGLNGLMVALFGLVIDIVLGIILSLFILITGTSFRQPDPSTADASMLLFVAGVSLALTFVGGYVGGRLGERSAT